MSAHMLHLFDLNGQPLPFNALLDTTRKLWVHLMEKLQWIRLSFLIDHITMHIAMNKKQEF